MDFFLLYNNNCFEICMYLYLVWLSGNSTLGVFISDTICKVLAYTRNHNFVIDRLQENT